MLRLCPFCQHWFEPARNNPKQKVCSRSSCQYQRRQKSRRALWERDALYRQTCRDAQAAWRMEQGTRYMREYRENHSAYTQQNRRRQSARDQRRKLLHLVKNNVALDLNPLSRQLFLVMEPNTPALDDLVKNNVALSAKLLIIHSLPSTIPTTTSLL